MPSVDTKYRAVCTVLSELSTPSQPPAPWAGRTDSAFVDLPEDPEALIRRLREQFSAKDLREAGVVGGKGSRTLQLSPRLAQNRRFIEVVRLRNGGEIADLVLTDGRSLSGERAWIAALHDERFQDAICQWRRSLFIVEAPEDMLVCRALGMPAVLAAGLASLTREECSKLIAILDFQTQADEESIASTANSETSRSNDQSDPVVGSDADDDDELRARNDDDLQDDEISSDELSEIVDVEDLDATAWGDRNDLLDQSQRIDQEDDRDSEAATNMPDPPDSVPLSLVLVDFSLATIGLPNQPLLLAVAGQLKELESPCGSPLADVWVWRPSADWLSRMRVAADAGDYSTAAALLAEDVEADFIPLKRWCEWASGEGSALVDNNRKLSAFVSTRPGAGEKAGGQLAIAEDELVITLAVNWAASCDDPPEALRRHLVVQMSRLALQKGHRLLHAICGVGTSAEYQTEWSSDSFSQYATLLDSILSGLKELTPCRPTPTRQQRRRNRRSRRS